MVVLSSFSAPTVGIKHLQQSTTLFIKGREVGVGTLYITDSEVSWRNDSSGEGFSLQYPTIAVHGISRDVAQVGGECLYVMVDNCMEDPDDNEGENGDGDDDDHSEGSTEMRFTPANKEQLELMYRAMSYCQALHPDPNDSPLSDDDDDDDGDDEDEQYEDAEGEGVDLFAGGDAPYIEGQPVGEPENGGRLDEEMEMDGQFQDAEDDD